MKQQLWDKEYEGGRWDLSKKTPNDRVYHFISQNSKKGMILELGCGSGNTGTELESESYSGYVGLDISEVAVDAAQRRSVESGRGSKNQYVQSDILKYVPDKTFQIVLFRDSIYYVPHRALHETLSRYARNMTPEGVFIASIFSRVGYRKWVETIERDYQVVDRYLSDTTDEIILVFRTKGIL